MADSPFDVGNTIARSLSSVAKALEAARREAIREVGAVAREEHMRHATEVPGSDRKFSGTDKFNKGRLGVKVRYEYGDAEVRVSPQGPWGLPAGRGRTKAGHRSWDKGEAGTTTKADRIVPATLDKRVQEGFRRG